MKNINLPQFALVVLIGGPGSGKSTFAAKHFPSKDILSLDACKSMLQAEGPSNQLEKDAEEVFHFVLEKRLKNKLFTILDAEHASSKDRKAIRLLAKKYHCPMTGLVFALPLDICAARLESAGKLSSLKQRLHDQHAKTMESIPQLIAEGFSQIAVWETEQAVEAVVFNRIPSRTDQKSILGPFDLIGDVQGSLEELQSLMKVLGYGFLHGKWSHPHGRKLVFTGDLTPYGPAALGVIQLVNALKQQGLAYCVLGDQDEQLLRHLQGQKVDSDSILEATAAQFEGIPPAELSAVAHFLKELPIYLELDEGRLIVAHAGLKAEMQGRESGDVRSFCLYGETTGASQAFGLPIQFNWAGDYEGEALVVYGHAAVPTPSWQGNTVNVATGCGFGGSLTALRYPERSIEQVPAKAMYFEPIRPLGFVPEESDSNGQSLLDISRFAGRNLASTRFDYHVTFKEDLAGPVMEALSHSRVNPNWYIYLPTFYSPPKASKLPGLLEHPSDAFNYYRKKGLQEVLVHDMDLGRRAVLVLCKDEEAANVHFGVANEEIGAVYGAKGQACFPTKSAEKKFLLQMQAAFTEAEVWEELESDWLCLEGELTPWGIGRTEMCDQFLGNVAVTAAASLDRALEVLEKGKARDLDTGRLEHIYRGRRARAAQFEKVAQNLQHQNTEFLMWNLLASSGKAYHTQPHAWHLSKLSGWAVPGLCGVPQHKLVALDSEEEIRLANRFWQDRTATTLAGMVVKPALLISEGGTDLIQPGMAVRGKEQLRRVFGPEYDDSRYLDIYRVRSLKEKRMQAVRQFALGWETMLRFVEGWEQTDVLECFYIGLSLNGKNLDPRL